MGDEAGRRGIDGATQLVAEAVAKAAPDPELSAILAEIDAAWAALARDRIASRRPPPEFGFGP